MPDQQAHRLELPSIRGPMNRVQTGPRSARRRNSQFQQMFSSLNPTVEARTSQCLSQLFIVPVKKPLLDPLNNMRGRAVLRLKDMLKPRKVAPAEAREDVVKLRCRRLLVLHR